MTEQWRTAVYDGIVYEKLYKVSNLGRILSLNYRNTGKPGLMTPRKRKDGYFQVGLSKNKETKKCYVHRLIAETFLPNPENKPCINHKIEGDEGKTMNMVIFNEDGSVDEERTTIEWTTYEENNNYGTHNERVSFSNKGEKNHFFGKHHTEESKKKISKAKKGKPAHNKGKPMSEEQKKKLSKAKKGKPAHNKGKPMSEEQKKKLSEAAKRRNLLKKMQPDGCLPL